jgi:phage baseplate assembly protein W
MLNITKIHPDDLNKNTTIGVSFPLMEGGIFKPTQTFKEQVKSNIVHVLMTAKGELINRPDFGVGLKNLIFEQNVDMEGLEANIKTQFDIHLPEIELNEVTAEFIESEYLIYIKIQYSIKYNQERDAVQINVGLPTWFGGSGKGKLPTKPKIIKRSAIINASS